MLRLSPVSWLMMYLDLTPEGNKEIARWEKKKKDLHKKLPSLKVQNWNSSKLHHSFASGDCNLFCHVWNENILHVSIGELIAIVWDLTQTKGKQLDTDF